MRTPAIAGIVALLVCGCASLGTPHAPVAVTPRGHRCVEQCQANHDRCLARASATEAEYWSFANPVVDACHDNLGRCYKTCPN